MDVRGTMSAFPNAGRAWGAESWVTAGVAAFALVVAATVGSAKESSAGSEPPSLSNKSTSSFQEERPPVGKGNVFSELQIRYCLAQIIRIEAVRTLVDRYKKGAPIRDAR